MSLQSTTRDKTTTLEPARQIGVLLSLFGAADAGYLSWLHLNNSIAAGCSVGSGCDVVTWRAGSRVMSPPTAARTRLDGIPWFRARSA